MLLRETGQDNYFSRTQLKEVVRKDHNSDPIQAIIDKLAKYSGPENLTVAIRFNQTAMLDLDEIVIPPELGIGAIWIYGAETPDGSRWLVRGNLMEREKSTLGWSFDYPVYAADRGAGA